MLNNWFLGYPKPTTRTYFTMEEVAEITKPDGDWGLWELESFAGEKIGVYQFINHPSWESKDNIYTKTLFSDYIWPQFWKSAIIYVDGEPVGDNWAYEDINEAWLRKSGLICRWINESKEVYETLITNLEANKSKLLNAIKTSTNTKFNDTPQEPGVFTEDEYTSSITATESATDAGTLMSRLKEIENDLRSLYGKWANEFSRFIIYSAI